MRKPILRGERFGRLTALTDLGPRGEGKKRGSWTLVRCDCGTEFEAKNGNLRSGNTTACGLHKGEPRRTYLESGARFGAWEVVQSDLDLGTNANGKTLARVRCDCGKEALVTVAGLRDGHTTSCGCAAIRTGRPPVHGYHGTRTYCSWLAMKGRCLRPSDTSYATYGAAGITVYPPWIDSFETFLRDMGERPEGTSLDRVDPFGNYEPGNCRWATPYEQTHNTRRNAVKEVMP